MAELRLNEVMAQRNGGVAHERMNVMCSGEQSGDGMAKMELDRCFVLKSPAV